MITARIMTAAVSLWTCLALTSYAGEQGSSGGQSRSFALPQHGELLLNVPSLWKQTVRRPPNNLPPTITFAPDQGDEFEVLITPIWSPQKDPSFNKPDKIKSLIDNDLRGMLPGAVEKEVSMQEFKSIDGTGYYFLVTDKAPKPGEYPYAVRAGVGVGDLLLSVTVLSKSKSTEGISSTIKALQEAMQIYGDGARQSVAGHPPENARSIHYRGKDFLDDASGVSVFAQGKDIIGLGNSTCHYLLVLPYSNEWTFDISETYHLTGHAGLLNMSIQVLLEADVSADEQLIQLKDDLGVKDVAPSKFEYVKHREETVLRTEVDCEKIDKVFEGAKQINFYAVKKWEQTMYTYHFSKMVSRDGSDPLSDEKILDFLTVGFFLNFKR